MDATALVQHYQIQVSALLQQQTLDNVTLSLGGSTLTLADLLQGQAIDAVGLTEYAILSVNDLTQAQILDAVTLGGLVIGELQGTLVVYALVDGEVTTYSLFDGNVTLH